MKTEILNDFIVRTSASVRSVVDRCAGDPISCFESGNLETNYSLLLIYTRLCFEVQLPHSAPLAKTVEFKHETPKSVEKTEVSSLFLLLRRRRRRDRSQNQNSPWPYPSLGWVERQAKRGLAVSKLS